MNNKYISNDCNTPSAVFLIKPKNFGFNSQTQKNNSFQNISTLSAEKLNQNALKAFESVIKLLEKNDIPFFVFDDTNLPIKPDAIFPNNWISCHPDGKIILYPMFAPNRRLERRMDIVTNLKQKLFVSEIIDLSFHENKKKYLEGTGSMVLDYQNHLIYACLSPRTDEELLNEYAKIIDYQLCIFKAYDLNKQPIYHTNVMMGIGRDYILACTESIDNKYIDDFLNWVKKTNKHLIPISLKQVQSFLGNVIELKSRSGKHDLIMSETAYKSLYQEQKKMIQQRVNILKVDISIIEYIGGGGIRCMLTGLFYNLFENKEEILSQ